MSVRLGRLVQLIHTNTDHVGLNLPMIVMSNLLDQGHRFEQEDDGKLLVGASRRRVDLPPSISMTPWWW